MLPAGAELLLTRVDGRGSGAGEILEALAERYVVTTTEAAPEVARVVVAGIDDPDEAAVRLASILDDIDAGWEKRLTWPRRAKQAT
jgi:hypothetical protein